LQTLALAPASKGTDPMPDDTSTLTFRFPPELRRRLEQEAKRRAPSYRKPNLTATLVDVLDGALPPLESKVRK
jgi:hypothetical protein